MASSDVFLVLNCGNTHVSASVFSCNGEDSLSLDTVQSIQLEYDYANDAGWLDAVGVAVRELKKSCKLPGRGIFILPGNQILTKQLQVPHVAPAKQRQIIAVEAQQSVHNFAQLEWDSQILHDDEIEADVLFLAARRQDLQDFYFAMKKAGVVPTEIAASSVLDYNTFLHTYPDFGTDCILLNMGAKTTNLLFATPDGFIARTINLGGNVLTQNIAEALGISFAEAEQQKVGYCTGEFLPEDDDPFHEVMENQRVKFLKRLNQELTRSIVSYRNQQKKQPPEYMLLTGKGSLLYGLPEFIAEKQNLEIHHLDPLGNVEIDGSIGEAELQQLYYEISESVGEAVRIAFPDRDGVGVNLLPSSIQRKVSMARRKPVILAASFFLAAAPIYPFLQIGNLNSNYESQLKYIQDAERVVSRDKRSILKNQEKCNQLNQEILKLEGLVNSKNNWIIFFTDLQNNLQEVEDVWLEDLSITRTERRETILATKRGEEDKVILHRTSAVRLTGRLLLRSEDGGASSIERQKERVRDLADKIKGSEFVQDVASLSYDDSNSGFLDFSFNLIIDPSKPL